MGNTIHTYILGAKIGQGSFGTVYKGTIRSKGKAVAIKILKEFDCKEIKTLKRANHENIVKLIDFNSKKSFIVLEFCEFGSLDGYLKNQQPDKKQRMKLITEMSAGLAYLHGIRIIHRDLKPANILVDKDRVAKIADFGLAKDVAQLDRSSSVETLYLGTEAGTVPYMAPEVFQRHYKFEADVFSLGLVFCVTLNEKCKEKIEQMWPRREYRILISFDGFMRMLIQSMLETNYDRRPSADSVHQKLLKRTYILNKTT